MNKEDLEKLNSFLSNMVVPPRRRELTRTNLLWLARNLAIYNSEAKNFQEAMTLIKSLLKK